MDDILVTGANDSEHKQILENTLKRLDSYSVKLQKSKCQFMQDQVEYFAFVVSKEGIKPLPRKLEAIRNMVDPKSKKEQVRPNDVWTCVACIYFIIKN